MTGACIKAKVSCRLSNAIIAQETKLHIPNTKILLYLQDI